MNNFKKRYIDTFNDIHAPTSIKQEVIRMSKKLNQNEEINNSNNVVETNQVEVSRNFGYGRVVAFATCIALIGGGAVGFNYFKQYNQDLSHGVEDTTTQEITGETLQTSVGVTSIIDNSNFEDIFGVKLESLKFNYLFGSSSDSVVKYCTSNDDIFKVANSLNTSSWIKEDIIPNNNDITTQLHLTLNTNDSDLIINFYTLKNGSNDIYVRVINEVKYVDACYKVDNNTYKTISATVNENNYFYFNVNPSNSLSITSNDNKSIEVTDNSIIKSIKFNLFDRFKWNLLSVDDVIKEENLETTIFEQSYDDVTYSIYLMKYESSLYARVKYSAFNQENNFLYELTSNSLEENYQKLIDLINGNNNTDISNAVTQVVTTPEVSTTTEKITTTTPITTTEKVTTTEETTVNTTTVTSQTDESVTTKKVYSIATPQLDYAININNPDTLPQFLTDEQQQLMAYAYSIVQGLNFNTPFEYIQDDYIVYNNNMYSRIKSPEINTLQDVKQYFEQYLTDNFIDNYISMNAFIEENGHVYGLNAGRGGNIYYIGHTFILDSQTDDKIVFHANAYYQTPAEDGEMYTGGYFYNQEPTVPYEISTCNYVLVKTNDGWRFDEFSVLL